VNRTYRTYMTYRSHEQRAHPVTNQYPLVTWASHLSRFRATGVYSALLYEPLPFRQ
jgi:hypothetical protein